MPELFTPTAKNRGWDGTRHWPFDKDPERCQCVMSHSTFEEGGYSQCSGTRDDRSNRFCTSCEDLHGAAAANRKKA